MARYVFGGSLPDWAFGTTTVSGTPNLAQVLGGQVITFYNAETGGTALPDLQDMTGGAITSVTSSDGSDGRAVGTIPPFRGPDGVWAMWAQAGTGPRALIISSDVGTVLGPLVDAVSAGLSAHTTGGSSAHALAGLADTNVPAPVDGYSLVWNAATARWIASNVAGLAAAAVVLTAGGSTIRIPDGDATTQAFRIRVPAGDRTTLAAPDTVVVEWNAGTDGAPDWRRVGWLNEFGEIRAQASAPSRVPLRIKQRDGTQTANLAEFTDNANNPLASVGAAGQMRGSNTMLSPVVFARAGALAVGTGAARVYNDTGQTLTVRSVRASVGTAPVGSSIIVDVNIGGTTIYSTGKPSIAAAANTSGKSTAMTTTAWPDGAYMTVDIDQVGSTTPGSDLVVQIAVY